jgi:hypothetical protein
MPLARFTTPSAWRNSLAGALKSPVMLLYASGESPILLFAFKDRDVPLQHIVRKMRPTSTRPAKERQLPPSI